MVDPILENRGLTDAGVDFLGGELCFGFEDQNDVARAQAGQRQNQAVGEVLEGVPDSGELENGFVE